MNDRLIFFLSQALKLVLKTFSFVLLRVLDEVKTESHGCTHLQYGSNNGEERLFWRSW